MAHSLIFIVCYVLIVSLNSCSSQEYVQNQRTTHITIGARKQGDRILDTITEHAQWAKPQDVRQEIFYPKNGSGPKITMFDIFVYTIGPLEPTHQLISGGVGQKNIKVALAARNVTYFKYTATAYGSSAAIIPSFGLVASLVIYMIYKTINE